MDWRWTGSAAIVNWRGEVPGKFRLGSAFPAGAAIQLGEAQPEQDSP
jgi:hypothetical protein